MFFIPGGTVNGKRVSPSGKLYDRCVQILKKYRDQNMRGSQRDSIDNEEPQVEGKKWFYIFLPPSLI